MPCTKLTWSCRNIYARSFNQQQLLPIYISEKLLKVINYYFIKGYIKKNLQTCRKYSSTDLKDDWYQQTESSTGISHPKFVLVFLIPSSCRLFMWSTGYQIKLRSVNAFANLNNSGLIENRRLLQNRGILSRIFETAATARLQVGVMLVHER